MGPSLDSRAPFAAAGVIGRRHPDDHAEAALPRAAVRRAHVDLRVRQLAQDVGGRSARFWPVMKNACFLADSVRPALFAALARRQSPRPRDRAAPCRGRRREEAAVRNARLRPRGATAGLDPPGSLPILGDTRWRSDPSVDYATSPDKPARACLLAAEGRGLNLLIFTAFPGAGGKAQARSRGRGLWRARQGPRKAPA